ncbi:MAG: hypothetical protein HOH29_02895 [Cellvibrionales bacterium]|nr:hypothetical protein [Cellvibrionales bacterium]
MSNDKAPKFTLFDFSHRLTRKTVSVMAFLCLLISTLFSQIVIAANDNSAPIKTTVILPIATGAAKMIYDEVISGIASHPELDVSSIAISSKEDIAAIEEKIKANQSQLIIAVGNRSYKLARALTNDILTIAGGISGKPNGIPTVSLTGDPAPAFEELKRIAPHIKNIRLVYNDEINGWWYSRAQKVAGDYDLKIIGYPATDMKDGVKLYEQLLEDATPKTSAVWIPLRSVVPSKTILPLLLEKAWSKKLAVISNNPSHTKLGGFIAVYPEHKKMGSQLAEFATHHFKGKDIDRIVGTENLNFAINLRTSSHIGIRLNAKERARFDKIFPTQR